MTLPDSLKNKIKSEAKEHASRNNVSWATRETENCVRDYLTGASALYSLMMEGAGDFDDMKVQAWFNSRPFDRAKNLREIDLVIDAAEFQFEQMKAQLDAQRMQIDEYKADLELANAAMISLGDDIKSLESENAKLKAEIARLECYDSGTL